MAQSRFEFGKGKILALPLPEIGKRATYYDTKIPKLALRVTSKGAKTFYVVKRVADEVLWLKLGSFPDMTVEQASKEAERILGSFAHGQNPAEVRRARKKEPTFAELFKEYGERHGIKKRSWNTDQSIYSNHLKKPLASRKLATVSRESVSRILSDLERAGKSGGTVNNVRALVSSVFSKAIEWGYATSNPVTGIKTRTKIKRDRFLQSEELPRFFKALAEEENETLRDYIILALLTGARRANLLAMRWKEINLADAVWRIPVTKNGTPQNVTLSPEAVTLLKARKQAADDKAVFVFPGIGESGHIEEPKKAVIRIMARAEIPYGRKVENGVTLHDLRRTLGSWQAKTGASLAIIGKSLNHQSQQTTAIYARLDLDPVRASVNTATAAMMVAAGLKPVAEVTQLKKELSHA
jgi:integrase